MLTGWNLVNSREISIDDALGIVNGLAAAWPDSIVGANLSYERTEEDKPDEKRDFDFEERSDLMLETLRKEFSENFFMNIRGYYQLFEKDGRFQSYIDLKGFMSSKSERLSKVLFPHLSLRYSFAR